MKIDKLDRPTLERLRKALDSHIANTTMWLSFEGVSIELGSCSYDSGQATFKLQLKVDGAETREQKALKLYARLDGIDLDKKHPHITLLEYHSKKRQYPYIYTDSRKPNTRFKGSASWAIKTFGMEMTNDTLEN